MCVEDFLPASLDLRLSLPLEERGDWLVSLYKREVYLVACFLEDFHKQLEIDQFRALLLFAALHL